MHESLQCHRDVLVFSYLHGEAGIKAASPAILTSVTHVVSKGLEALRCDNTFPVSDAADPMREIIYQESRPYVQLSVMEPSLVWTSSSKVLAIVRNV